MKLYDFRKKQLIIFQEKADSSFWDSHWRIDKNIKNKIFLKKDSLITRVTRKFLRPQAGPILEGGSGSGQNVAALKYYGYQVIGIDYASQTVRALNKWMPELDIRHGDVRKLPFKDNFFSGYWSLGVIEHFFSGYRTIALEIERVVKTGGYLFLTFPFMSPLRKIKAGLGFYLPWSKTRVSSLDNFYQYILNKELVIKNFQSLNFKLVQTMPFDDIKGVKNEIKFLRPLFQRLLDHPGRGILKRAVPKIIFGASSLFTPITGHA
ncbi:class I SAM-dependent methyltransferase, partial [Patescibacteria group bacterium]|nr:class I SAM-dependent methyltransferase [Patescibacteria group bacterium]